MRFWLILLLLGLLLPACQPSSGGDDDDDDDAVGDDDDSAVADDDDAVDDDDDATQKDPPELLASYDFVLVMFRNDPYGVYEVIDGQMDILVSTTDFIAELQTEGGQTWTWSGRLENNATAFDVIGRFQPPGATEETWVQVRGNFLGDAAQNPSQVCLTGLGEDDDPNYPNQGIQFAWYGCQLNAPALANDPSGPHNVSVTVNGDECGQWTGQTSWVENWSFDTNRRLTVTRGNVTGYGVVSDDGNVFRYTMLEQENPGRALKVVGNLADANAVTEAVAQGYCHGIDPPAAVLQMDY